MSEKKQPVDLGLLEEDDEFEEFPAEDWAGLDEDEDAHVWEDNWDDDNVEDDFSNQLRCKRAVNIVVIEISEAFYSLDINMNVAHNAKNNVCGLINAEVKNKSLSAAVLI
ncbi:26S proteasome complex subunit DSS1 [Heterocephalus glaber]|uniref:26S proteasome complex subunit SEM1 n=1 Tax=Heterocephalus glaber TaxID=10181 RepID=G5BLD0_HETGA|nr:26S proteasome complex subunit DSS1 [Heterocephalus glaber]